MCSRPPMRRNCADERKMSSVGRYDIGVSFEGREVDLREPCGGRRYFDDI